jgi:hypothetical protein
MRFWLMALLFSTVSFAQTRERNIFDLQYLPEKKVVFGITDIEYSKGFDRESNQYTKAEATSFNQVVGYSFTDNFYLALAGNYLSSRTRSRYKFDSLDADINTEVKGVSDPSLSGKYRLQDNYFRVDLISALFVKSGDSERDGNEYNNKIGGHVFAFGLDVGQKFELVQWFLEVIYIRAFESTTVTKNEKTTQDPFNAYSTTFAVLGYVADKTLLKGSVSTSIADPLGRDTRSTIQKLSVGPEVQYMFTENFLLRTGIAFQTNQVTSRDGTDEGWNYSVGANYQF